MLEDAREPFIQIHSKLTDWFFFSFKIKSVSYEILPDLIVNWRLGPKKKNESVFFFFTESVLGEEEWNV